MDGKLVKEGHTGEMSAPEYTEFLLDLVDADVEFEYRNFDMREAGMTRLPNRLEELE